jgi:hypothetical protein
VKVTCGTVPKTRISILLKALFGIAPAPGNLMELVEQSLGAPENRRAGVITCKSLEDI